ncbi:MAG TPA: hypothetical protein VJT49_07685 [Amycolatopsis sp.]|uniref:hypothetical protein n=1 Tax=Amycolatopsis sp. TaxID=37632 RepID=UPI002B46F9F2|nr:hypothetical protein [Amycolatopsis sp.]HKS44987.1 hypothetical protein [Amycolatopsis sp.]
MQIIGTSARDVRVARHGGSGTGGRLDGRRGSSYRGRDACGCASIAEAERIAETLKQLAIYDEQRATHEGPIDEDL